MSGPVGSKGETKTFLEHLLGVQDGIASCSGQ
jgi:hypothetical protein